MHLKQLLPLFALVILFPALSHAQATVRGDAVIIEKAQVVSIGKHGVGQIAGTGASEPVQTITAKVLSGPESGKSVTFDILYMINSEMFATEIIRILIGSIGLIIAVPITTAIAVYLLSSSRKPAIAQKN